MTDIAASGGAAGGGAEGERASELALQRRWAESCWPAPFLETGGGRSVRVIWPGRWNRGPGPDFRGAQILDADGRARRGDIELHLEAGGWLQHGHSDDPAYHDLLLHLVERPRRPGTGLDPRIPDATLLPSPRSGFATHSAAEPPCADVVERAGPAAVEARLLRIARRRFLRKVAELHALAVPEGPGSERDRRAVIAAARALGQPHNADLAERAAQQAIAAAARWPDVRPVIESPAEPATGGGVWRRGRGALGTPDGLSLVLVTLLGRWTAADGRPWSAFERLASLPLPAAVAELRIAKHLGSGRVRQLLADAVYPLSGAWSAWQALPGSRYQRTDELRARLERDDHDGGAPLGWRHPQTQALLELERTRCSQGACRICPLAALTALMPRP